MKGDFTRRTFRPEKRYSGVYMQQGRVQLDADWNEQVEIQNTSLRTALSDVIGAHGTPADAAGNASGAFRIDAEGKFLTVARGRYYVEGVLCDNGEGEAEVLDESLHLDPGHYVAMLDCWEHHVTAVEDPYLREIALGGPDTCTRSQIHWKVRLVSAQALAQQGLGSALRGDVSSGRICLQTLSGGYLRPDNSHYRIEIHRDCDGTRRPAFKWSRSNASLSTIIQSILSEGAGGQSGVTRLRLELGYQEDNRHLRLSRGQWIEISEEERVLGGLPGLMAQITAVDGTSLLVELPSGAEDEGYYTELTKRNGAAATRTVIARQWDGFEAEQQAWNWELRADGISIEFEQAQSYRAYDYWMIPARSQTGELDWPCDENGNPEFMLPTGVRHYLAPLADLRRNDDGTWTVVQDRRRHFHAATAHRDGAPKPPPPLPRLRIRKVLRLLGGDKAKDLRNNDEIRVSELANGVCLLCDAAIVSPVDRGNCLIAVELPFPRTWWQKLFDLETEVGAYLQMVLTGEPDKRGDAFIAWRPTPPAVEFLQKTLDDLAALGTERPRILARWTVKGNMIYGLKDGLPAYLDGEVFGKPGKDGSVELDLAIERPSGDGKPGGTFEMWFWITPDPE